MKNKYTCAECGNEIIFIYETPSRVFSIEDGELVRDDNNMTDNADFIPYCSFDKEHTIYPGNDMEFWNWINEVEFYFKEKGLYALGEN